LTQAFCQRHFDKVRWPYWLMEQHTLKM